MKKAILQLEPLTCPSCIKKIEGAMAKTKGVESAKVLFNAGKVRAEYDSSQVELSDLANVIEGLGYKVLKQKAS